ncbi:MAG TPA: DUF4168 domain-containing protein [Alphaproteobacteria bacterium]|nr:DUF4168 domain-containing protein [Alphaproteobacteria bacterium]
MADTQDFDAGTLDSFVEAFVQINQIGRAYGDRLTAAGTPEEQQQIRMQANSEMVQAIDKIDGIDVDQYNTIVTKAQQDPDLAARINERLGGGEPG